MDAVCTLYVTYKAESLITVATMVVPRLGHTVQTETRTPYIPGPTQGNASVHVCTCVLTFRPKSSSHTQPIIPNTYRAKPSRVSCYPFFLDLHLPRFRGFFSPHDSGYSRDNIGAQYTLPGFPHPSNDIRELPSRKAAAPVVVGRIDMYMSACIWDTTGAYAYAVYFVLFCFILFYFVLFLLPLLFFIFKYQPMKTGLFCRTLRNPEWRAACGLLGVAGWNESTGWRSCLFFVSIFTDPFK